MSLRKLGAISALTIILVAAACGGSDAPRTEPSATGKAAGQVNATTASTVAPTGKVIEVAMITDGEGNYFEPADFEARRGDLVRFVLVSGVHNVSFPANKNKGKTDLPAASDYLQLPGQAFDLLVTMDPGSYFYHCDPHAALGMVGNIEVLED